MVLYCSAGGSFRMVLDVEKKLICLQRGFDAVDEAFSGINWMGVMLWYI